MPLRFTARDGAALYVGEFRAEEFGPHRAELNATGAGVGSVTAQSDFLVTELNREFYDSAQNEELLRRVASETGGKYYTLARPTVWGRPDQEDRQLAARPKTFGTCPSTSFSSSGS